MVEVEGPVKARSLELYARPNAGTSDGDAAVFEALPGETEAAQVERLKELLRAQWHELLEVSGHTAHGEAPLALWSGRGWDMFARFKIMQ